jgi:hypothetical protein
LQRHPTANTLPQAGQASRSRNASIGQKIE